MKTYIKKPVSIQAIQWTGENLFKVVTFIEGKPELNCDSANAAWEGYCDYTKESGLTIDTLEGEMKASIGDYIIKGVSGEFYPCKPDIFKKTYYTLEEYAEFVA